jgi:hypothetical protein
MDVVRGRRTQKSLCSSISWSEDVVLVLIVATLLIFHCTYISGSDEFAASHACPTILNFLSTPYIFFHFPHDCPLSSISTAHVYSTLTP